jgi:pyruvate kinase
MKRRRRSSDAYRGDADAAITGNLASFGMDRRTKIVATIGPASASPAVLHSLVGAGMDVARVSLAHETIDGAREIVAAVRAAAAEQDRIVGVLADLPGPKIRAGAFPDGGVDLHEGDALELVTGAASEGSTDKRIAVDHAEMVGGLRAGDRVAIGDGGVVLRVVDGTDVDRVSVEVVSGGRVQGHPGVSPPTDRATLEAPTNDDLRLLDALGDADVDAVAISFVRSAADVQKVRAAVGVDGPMLVAKIETPEAVEDIERIIAAADGVMVARGDLGIRCPLEDVPHHQKLIIRTAVAFGRPVITATQMLESMVRAPTPTRAEVSDVANAVFDGSSALMLSAETAIGHDPVAAVGTMARVAARAEQDFDHVGWGRNLGRQQQVDRDASPVSTVTAALSAAAWHAAADADAVAILACTTSGATARAIARFRPSTPILAVTPSLRTARQLAVAWGITPVVDRREGSTDDITRFAVARAVEVGAASPGDVVAVLLGSSVGSHPVTDILRLVRVG